MHKLNTDDCCQWTLTWLERSKPHLVSVVLDYLGPADYYPSTWHRNNFHPEHLSINVLHIFTEPQSAYRLRQLDIRSQTPKSFKFFLRELRHAPYLEHLSLYSMMDPYQVGDWVTFATALRDIDRWPGLKNCRATLPNVKRFMFKSISPPFIPNLTSLTIHNLLIDYGGAKALFTTSPHLTQLALHDLQPIKEPAAGPFPPIVAASLRSLAIKIAAADWGWRYFFIWVSMPNLDCLELNGDIHPPSVFGWTSTSPLPPITKLRMINGDRTRVIVKFYHSLSCVEELELVNAPAEELFFITELQKHRDPQYNNHAQVHTTPRKKKRNPYGAMPPLSPVTA
ncbi:hypothetical protein CPB84DRAFT_282017 [Gymnopilus junonius]|uniref:Uncharacterized protein n=1 Tax=Gymnopilus junonius TaxID=109634 RepID=A0A9P5TH31_GYMJU|nr:hypothetical protein CPB84DRAFT_282017 [Gymnopilus junonius]